MDPFATKGIEYVLVLLYLALFIPFWMILRRILSADPSVRLAPAVAPLRRNEGWFHAPADRFYHRGHTWAREIGAGLFEVGLDDFAQKLLGKPSAIALPPAGARLEQGEPGWNLLFDGQEIDVLSPVDGEVVERNARLRDHPEQLCEDPYGEGWLMRVRVPRPKTNLRNLMTGELGAAWLDASTRGVQRLAGDELGVVLPDGGVPVPGFVRHLAGDRWPEVVREFLLT